VGGARVRRALPVRGRGLPGGWHPAWQQLDHTDPRKWAAVLDAGQHWCLRIDTLQADRADASKAVAAAEDWRQIASGITQMRAAEAAGVRIPRWGVAA
jgi:hypothetical protein